ncbi:hypothetical protein SAY87_006670 [Trapa incisa]|uniref:S-protein homolog n=1 Tax=Trapa incisa TaxID=236973 RepID=A0AAN7PZK6_9MYRT|nr:hypothetical protein SAY87_006670 [Trapa incisa]
MIHKNKRAILLRLLVCVAAALDIGEDQSTIHITVWNDLLPGRKFIIHCKSKDDDLGAITVPQSLSYTFSFKPNIIGTTLFFCGVYTDYGHGSFDIFRYSRDAPRCYKCRWSVRENGVYGYKDDQNMLDLFFEWTR